MSELNYQHINYEAERLTDQINYLIGRDKNKKSIIPINKNRENISPDINFQDKKKRSIGS